MALPPPQGHLAMLGTEAAQDTPPRPSRRPIRVIKDRDIITIEGAARRRHARPGHL